MKRLSKTTNKPTEKIQFFKKRQMTTIKNKMLIYTLLIIILMTFLSIYSLTIINVYKNKIDAMFERNIALKDIRDTLSVVDQELVVYLSTKNSTSLNLYMQNSESLRLASSRAVEEVRIFSEEELMVLDVHNMVFNYLIEADKAIEEKRKDDILAYTKRYTNTLLIKSYILDFINELNIRQLDRNAISYIYMTNQIETSTFLNIFLIVDLILLSIIIVLKMTNNMINPIVRLSHSAEAIAKGDFKTEEIHVESNDEIQILAQAFNRMKRSIHAYIEELKEKAFTEAKLKDQQMENLKMQSLLDNAKLYALQSQMNPHFLFNTINAGVQMAMIEGADRTSEFLECMSRLFRYNIKKIDQAVTIKQEIDNVRDYYELLKVRFEDLITFTFILDESGLDYPMPPLILQPLVENSYIHGLSKKEDGGQVKIQALNKGNSTLLVIEDTGIGMSEEHIERILCGFPKKDSSMESMNNQSNGIGMNNVIERLELFYKQRNLLKITSIPGQGTKVIIEVPHIKGEPR